MEMSEVDGKTDNTKQTQGKHQGQERQRSGTGTKRKSSRAKSDSDSLDDSKDKAQRSQQKTVKKRHVQDVASGQIKPKSSKAKPGSKKDAVKKKRAQGPATLSDESRAGPSQSTEAEHPPKLRRKLTKSDYMWIWKQRKNWWKPESRMKKVADIAKLVEPISDKEKAGLFERYRSASGKTAKAFETELKKLGIPCSEFSKEDSVEALNTASEKGKKKEPGLDNDQLVVLKQAMKEQELVIQAGPGSGKTTVLSHLVADVLCKASEKRILVLCFNRMAKREMTAKLRKHLLVLLQKNKALSSKSAVSCLVTTFNLFGFWAVDLPEETDLMSPDERVNLKQSAALLEIVKATAPARQWDWIIVDGAQDLNDTHQQIVQLLRMESTHLVVAGDLCQRVYPEIKCWFSDLVKSKTVGKDLVLLKRNYRSSPEIVEKLNNFGEKNFQCMQFDKQTAARDGSGTFVTLRAVSNKTCAEEITRMTNESNPRDAFVISPVTVNACNRELTQTIRQNPSKKQPKWVNLVYSKNCPTGVPLSDLNGCVVSTARALREGERSRVVLYGITELFAQEGVSEDLMKRLIYVAMSRARDHLLVIAETALPSESPLSCFSFLTKEVTADHKQSTDSSSIEAADLKKESYRYLQKNPVPSNKNPDPSSSSASPSTVPIQLHRSDKVAGSIKVPNSMAT